MQSGASCTKGGYSAITFRTTDTSSGALMKQYTFIYLPDTGADDVNVIHTSKTWITNTLKDIVTEIRLKIKTVC